MKTKRIEQKEQQKEERKGNQREEIDQQDISDGQRELKKKIKDCRELIVQSLQHTIQHKMFYMFLKEQELDSGVQQFMVNAKDGLVKILFQDHQKAMSFYNQLNFRAKLLTRQFNIYFPLSLSQSEMKKYYVQGITEDNQRKLFEECRKIGVLKLYTSYTQGKRPTIKPNGILSFVRCQNLSEGTFEKLSKNLKALGIKIDPYIKKKKIQTVQIRGNQPHQFENIRVDSQKAANIVKQYNFAEQEIKILQYRCKRSIRKYQEQIQHHNKEAIRLRNTLKSLAILSENEQEGSVESEEESCIQNDDFQFISQQKTYQSKQQSPGKTHSQKQMAKIRTKELEDSQAQDFMIKVDKILEQGHSWGNLQLISLLEQKTVDKDLVKQVDQMRYFCLKTLQHLQLLKQQHFKLLKQQHLKLTQSNTELLPATDHLVRHAFRIVSHFWEIKDGSNNANKLKKRLEFTVSRVNSSEGLSAIEGQIINLVDNQHLYMELDSDIQLPKEKGMPSYSPTNRPIAVRAPGVESEIGPAQLYSRTKDKIKNILRDKHKFQQTEVRTVKRIVAEPLRFLIKESFGLADEICSNLVDKILMTTNDISLLFNYLENIQILRQAIDKT